MKISPVSFNWYSQNISQRKKINPSFGSISASEEELKSLSYTNLEFLRDYAKSGRVFKDSKYIDAKLKKDHNELCAYIKFKPEFQEKLKQVFPSSIDTCYGHSETPQDWIGDLQMSGNGLRGKTEYGRGIVMVLNDEISRFKTVKNKEAENYQPRPGVIPPPKTITVCDSKVAEYIDGEMRAIDKDVEERYKNYTSKNTIKTLLLGAALEKIMPEIEKNVDEIENNKNKEAEEKSNLMAAIMSGNYPEIKEVEKTSANKTEEEKSLDENKITFKDIGGQDEAIKVMKRSVLFPMLYPEAFKNNSIKHGFILCGPPGTGKSLMAEALANESKAHFIKINANELDGSLVGQTEEHWRNLFEEARKHQPAIIFMDEFDAIAKKRNGMDVYGEKALNQILALISDVEKKKERIYFIGATNKPDMLDSAIKRSGRFGTQIEMTAPKTIDDIEAIFNIHTKNQPLDPDINKQETFNKLLSLKATGADIAIIVYNASENAKERKGIYEAMENRTFKNEDMNDLTIKQIDIDKAIEQLKQQRKISE